MKLYDGGLIILIIIVTTCVVGGFASKYFLGADNIVEETAEDVIEKETGMKVDLSPSTPENLT